jgi:formate dehydrogenase subunit delta
MSGPAPERLIYMANQIAKYFVAQPGADGAAAVADHLKKFWDPSMRADILAWTGAGGGGLEPLAARAVELLRAERG